MQALHCTRPLPGLVVGQQAGHRRRWAPAVATRLRPEDSGPWLPNEMEIRCRALDSARRRVGTGQESLPAMDSTPNGGAMCEIPHFVPTGFGPAAEVPLSGKITVGVIWIKKGLQLSVCHVTLGPVRIDSGEPSRCRQLHWRGVPAPDHDGGLLGKSVSSISFFLLLLSYKQVLGHN